VPGGKTVGLLACPGGRALAAAIGFSPGGFARGDSGPVGHQDAQACGPALLLGDAEVVDHGRGLEAVARVNLPALVENNLASFGRTQATLD